MNKNASHQKIQNFLERVIVKGRVSHAYLFIGPRDCGKRAVARWFFSQLTNLSEEKLLTSPDFCEINGQDGAIGIELVRELRERLNFSSSLGEWKIALIASAAALTPEAANALLKTLEEPKHHVCIILTIEHLDSILPTIVSRCEILKFPASSEFKPRQKDVDCLKQLLAARPGERFLDSKKLAERESLEEMLDSWIFFLRDQMHIHYNKKDIVLRLLKAKELLKLNINKQLIVEDILINL